MASKNTINVFTNAYLVNKSIKKRKRATLLLSTSSEPGFGLSEKKIGKKGFVVRTNKCVYFILVQV